ncbi:hypothetical protein [Vaginisenegalia massiliensis]|uniref:hypothetical protein n=1 Tax=Vaginisenegalia massiliensis TaxID=2058294 RepID=UPI0013DE1552|nr:hypothetical protein [Vaginisenegalia massiliensis]
MTSLINIISNFEAVETIRQNDLNMKHIEQPQLVVSRRQYLAEMKAAKGQKTRQK